MRKLIFILGALLAGIVGAAAAESADAFLGRVADNLRKARSVTASFAMTAGSEKVSGTLTLAGTRFHISTPQLSTWYDGKTQWAYSPQAAEVNITEPTPDELAQVNPFAIISAFRRGYKASWGTGSAASQKTVVLKALQKKAEISSATVTFNAKTLMPVRIVLTMAGGRVTVISVTSARTGAALPLSAFTFDARKHPGVEVVDLR